MLASQEEATLVNISSGLGYLPSSAHAIYSASKAAVAALTTALNGQAQYFGYHKLHIVQVAPPLVSETNLNKTMHQDGTKNPVNMKLDALVRAVLKGIQKNQRVINPGPSKLRSLLGKFAPISLKIRLTWNTMTTEFGHHNRSN